MSGGSSGTNCCPLPAARKAATTNPPASPAGSGRVGTSSTGIIIPSARPEPAEASVRNTGDISGPPALTAVPELSKASSIVDVTELVPRP
ncbi:unnamed protein product [Ectocarpus sp. 6 AP-2014]